MKLIEGGNNKRDHFDIDMVADYFIGLTPESEFDEKRQAREVDKFYKFMETVKNYKFSKH